MTTRVDGENLVIGQIAELSAQTANHFKGEVRQTFRRPIKNLEIDLSQTTFLDSSGLGALVALYKDVTACEGTFRLLHPTSAIRQLLELTRMDRIFEIEPPSPPPPTERQSTNRSESRFGR